MLYQTFEAVHSVAYPVHRASDAVSSLPVLCIGPCMVCSFCWFCSEVGSAAHLDFAPALWSCCLGPHSAELLPCATESVLQLHLQRALVAGVVG